MRGLSLHRVGWRHALRLPPQRRCASTKLPSEPARHVDFSALDAKWQAQWGRWKREEDTTPAKSGHGGKHKEKAYILPMFPYPSGTLHLGHLRVYTISDVLARFKQLQGCDVLHPIGWDAFGLPAENAAIERGVHPEKWTLQNIEAMKEQMMAMGGRWDWDREIRTCDPAYYKHNQLIFLQLLERGLAYQAESLVNYDPVDKTVLANEQVDANGCSWRSGAKVQKIMLKQWFLKIKEYQDSLLDDLKLLALGGNWPERVIAQQRNWLGKSEGTKLTFDVQSTEGQRPLDPIRVFTTRADTLFGVHYVALSLNHPIVTELADKDASLRNFLLQAQILPPDSKEGYLLPNVTAINPMSELIPSVDRAVPVYVAPYVLDYGYSAVMGVPGHDTRDNAFWRANAGNSPIRKVITSELIEDSTLLKTEPVNDQPMTEKGYIVPDIEGFSGLFSDWAVDKVIKLLQEAGKDAEKVENWRLRDWLISRQRYWGTPIPVIHCDSCGPVPVPEEDLPVTLPDLPDSFFQGRSGNPLAEDTNWKKTACPKCGSSAERETDTMDTFMDSSWYFFRFLDPHNEAKPVGSDKAKNMPVDIYVGGVEHAILHLLYARFISKFFKTLGWWPHLEDDQAHGEPFRRLITQGMVHGKTYSDPETGRFLRPDEVDFTNSSSPVMKSTKASPNVSYEKMSKSKYNGVDPGATIAKYGADVTRAHMLFQAPISDVLDWDESSITGVQRWLTRVIRLSNAASATYRNSGYEPLEDLDQPWLQLLLQLSRQEILPAIALDGVNMGHSEGARFIARLEPAEQHFWARIQEVIASVTQSYSETYSLNTIVSDLMTLTNHIEDEPHISDTMVYLKYLATAHLLRMTAPIAPAVAEESWEVLRQGTNGPSSIFDAGFPVAEVDLIPLLRATRPCVFTVNGKKKFEVIMRKPSNELLKSGKVELANWVLEHLQRFDEGKEWLEHGIGKLWTIAGTNERNRDIPSLPTGYTAVVAKKGQLVNIVPPKKKKKAATEDVDS
ncbi:leucyl-tRNA synthetase [Lophiotrema nucula]|uniref:leucine--tRNA ligase n=1 Tax=Lophiotrema nucula TaxID=690887 RepID=A0A6A5ZR13_9PLEO|nr:leucyl-tRNA synthetase [Lophiotrema nucula]